MHVRASTVKVSSSPCVEGGKKEGERERERMGGREGGENSRGTKKTRIRMILDSDGLQCKC